jgi:hypothetical protein
MVNATDPYCRILGFLDRGRIKSTDKCNDFIGNRTRDILSCNIVPQPTMLLTYYYNNNNNNNNNDGSY